MKLAAIVVDSSVIVKWISKELEENLVESQKLLEDIISYGTKLYTPSLALYEVGNVLLHKSLPMPEQIVRLHSLYSLPLQYISPSLQQEISTLEVASRHKITFYDSAFLTLAHSLNCPLVTANPKHQQKFKEVKVIPLKSYR